MAEKMAADPVEAAANVMARQRAGVRSRSTGQLDEVNKTLKTQNASQKLKRTPSVQERVRTNDSMVMILAKVYAITKKEQEVNKNYRKEQIEKTNKFNESLIDTLKSTSDNIKKAIEKSVKVNETLLEDNKMIREENKLFEEEKNEEAQKLEERRHKELLEAIKDNKDSGTAKPEKKEKGGILGMLAALGAGLTKIFPGFGKFLTVIKAIYKLGEVVFKIARFILPLAKDLIMFLVRNPQVLAALGALAAVIKMKDVTDETKRNKEKEIADKLQNIEESSKNLAEKGDVAGLKKLQEQRDELKNKQAVIDVMEGRRPENSLSTKIAEENKTYVEDKLFAAAKAGSKPAQEQLNKMDEERVKKEVGTKSTYSSKTYSPEGIELSDTGITYEEAHKDAKKKFLKEREDRFKETEKKKSESGQMGNMTFAEVVNKNFQTIKEREGFKRTAYESAEKGTDSVGIGHKLTDAEAKAGGVFIKGQLVKVDRKTPLTDQQVLDLYHQDINLHMNSARKKIGADVFDKLPGNKQYALAELNFAGGENTLPTGGALVKAVRAGNMEEAERQIRGTARYYQKPVTDASGKPVIDPVTGKQKKEKVENKRMAEHAEKRADLFAKGLPGAGDTQMAKIDTPGTSSTSTIAGLPSDSELNGLESIVGADTTEPEKPSTAYGLIAEGLKSQIQMIKGFASGEGAKELQDVLDTTKSMFAEVAPPSVSPALSALTDVQKTNTALSGKAGATNITNINQQQLAQGGGGTGSSAPPANIYDVANPSVQAALYGIHNVRVV